jgi:hypothetical protein
MCHTFSTVPYRSYVRPEPSKSVPIDGTAAPYMPALSLSTPHQPKPLPPPLPPSSPPRLSSTMLSSRSSRCRQHLASIAASPASQIHFFLSRPNPLAHLLHARPHPCHYKKHRKFCRPALNQWKKHFHRLWANFL